MAWQAILKGLVVGAAACVVAVQVNAEAQRGPVVVELYTSQGCSACPPADEMLHRLAARDDVIALAMHVDYWDYIGWKDVFARPEHAVRQRGFAEAIGQNMIYTPQMIIDGVAHVVGNKPMAVSELLMTHADTPDPVAVQLTLSDGTLQISAQGVVDGPVDVHLVRFSRAQSVDITRGENRGKTISYTNVVRDWQVVGTWDGAGDLQMQTPATGEDPLAVLVQAPDYGPILGAAALR